MSADNDPIIVEQSFSSSIEKVWEALTEVSQMRQWFFEHIEDFDPKVGFETQFNVHNQGRDFLHQWKLTAVIPHKKIIYHWKYKGYEGNSYVTFELQEKNNQTVLKLTHEGGETFPKNIPEFSRQSGIDGWNYFIKESLKDYLEKA